MAFGRLDLEVGASVGTATYPQDGTSFDALLAHADTRMYEVKSGDGERADIDVERRQGLEFAVVSRSTDRIESDVADRDMAGASAGRAQDES